MKSKYPPIATTAILIFLLILGTYLRVARSSGELTSNLPAFFYTRARMLNENSQYPSTDKGEFAPLNYKENYPPLLEIFTVLLYRVANVFVHSNFYDFVVMFPVMMFVIISLVGYYILNKLFNNTAALFYVALMTLLPSGVGLTEATNYTEVSMGVLLFITTFYFVIKFKENLKKGYRELLPVVISLTLLTLTWQTFVFFYILLTALLLMDLKNKKAIKKYLAVLIVPLLLGHIISKYIIGIDYSPVEMFYEYYLSFKNKNDLTYNIVFSTIFTGYRRDLSAITLSDFTDSFTWMGLIFLVIGLIYSLANFEKDTYKISFLATLLGLAFLFSLEKLEEVALPFVVITSSIGLEKMYNLNFSVFEKDMSNLPALMKKRFRFVYEHKKMVFVLLLVGISVILYELQQYPNPYAELTGPTENIVRFHEYNYTLKLTNFGYDTLCYSGHNGFHVEALNATITYKKAFSNFTYAYIAYDNPYGMPGINVDWFEAKYLCVPSKESVYLNFTIRPYNLPVRIYYRAWMPQQTCLYGIPPGMNPQYAAAWRNEMCLHRFPTSGANCTVTVFAGYNEKQFFPCIEQKIG